MLKIAVDFDNVLADTTGVWIEYYNRIYNKRINKHDITEYHFWETRNISREEVYRIYHLVWSNWKELPMIEKHCTSIVNEIKRIAEVDVVTSALTDIKHWLAKNELHFDKIVYTLQKSHLNYDIFIDDSPIEAINIIRNNKMCLLYDQPWNRSVEFNGLMRIKSLAETIDVIKEISQKGKAKLNLL